MKEITKSSIISRSKEIVFNKLDDEIMMMSIKNSEYYGLDNIASRVWEILANPSTLSQIVKTLMEEFEVSEESCYTDITEFLKALDEKNLIEISQ
jgi:hypothetical protein